MSVTHDNKSTGDGQAVLSSPYMYKYYALAGAVLLTSLVSVAADTGLLFVIFQIVCLGAMLLLIGKGREEKLKSDQIASETRDDLRKIADDQDRKLEATKNRARQEELEKEKQLKLNEFLLSDHFAPFIDKLKKTETDDIDGLTHTQFMELYVALEETFKRNNRLPLSRLADIPEDVRRVNQIETLIDLYGKKMQRVRADGELDEEDRDHKIANWERMMERDISRLEEA